MYSPTRCVKRSLDALSSGGMGAHPGQSTGTEGAGDWIVGETLGRGGVGVVYAATHAGTGARGALKVAHRDSGAVRAHWFRRERDLAARLRHPHIVALLDVGELSGDRPYLVYERVEGTTLEEAGSSLTLPQVIQVGCELLDALGYAHDAGVIHCDVTPANVMLAGVAPSYVTKLTDFGLARAKADSHQRRLGSTMQVSGTPGYLSPEQAKGVGSPGPSSDLFSCGAVLFRLLTGYAPYGGETALEVVRHTMTGAPLPLRPRTGLRAPMKLAQVVQKLLARDPEDRYANAAQAREAWERAASSGTPIKGTVRPHVPATPGLQSLETIMVENVKSDEAEPQFSTMRQTPAAGLLRNELPWQRSSAALLGRDDELRVLLDALPPEGAEPSLVAIRGEAGVGKTALLDALRKRLRDDGVRVYTAHGRMSGPCPPMEVLATLALHAIGAALVWPARLAAERLAQALAKLEITDPAGTQDALVGGLLGVGPRGGGPSAVMEAFDGFESLLAVDYRPVVLIVDDAGGLDEGTWEVLRSAALKHPGQLGVVWCGDGEPPPDLACVVDLSRPDAEVLDALWQRDAPPGLHRPRELDLPTDVTTLAGLVAQGTPPSFAAYVAELAHHERTTLEVAAVYGGDIPKRGLPKLASTLGVQLGGGHDAVDTLLRHGAIAEMAEPAARMERWVRLPSVGLRAAVLAQMEPDWREHVHAVAAQWLARECLDDNASTRARIAELALAAKLPRSAAHALAEAGRLELESGRPARARPYLERAVELTRDAKEPAIDMPRSLAQLAEIALAIGQPVRCAELCEETLPLLEPRREVLHARLLGLRAEALGQTGRIEDSVGVLEEAIAVIGDDGDPIESASLHASLGWVLGYRLGQNARGIEHGRRALDIASRIHAPAFRASLCGRLGANYLRAGDWDGQLETNFEDLRLSTKARDPRGIVRANINLGVCFHNRGELDTARTHTDRARDLAQRCGSDGALQIAHNNLAMIALDDGRLDDVTAHVEAVLEASERSGYRRAVPETLITLARLETQRGRLDEADEALGRAEREGDVADLEAAQRARAWLEVARGELEVARARMSQVCSQPEHDPHERALSRITHAAILRRLGQDDDAVGEEQLADHVFEVLGADGELERRRWGGAG